MTLFQYRCLESLNDLAALFSARLVALPLTLLLAFKIYSLSPSALIYATGLAVITSLLLIRWSLHFIVKHKKLFAQIYAQQQKNT